MYCMNTTIVVDHNGLFIHIDSSYPESYHNVNVL